MGYGIWDMAILTFLRTAICRAISEFELAGIGRLAN